MPGEGHALAERRGEMSADLSGLLNKAAKKPCFEDDELDFQRGYCANLDAVLALLAKRFTA